MDDCDGLSVSPELACRARTSAYARIPERIGLRGTYKLFFGDDFCLETQCLMMAIPHKVEHIPCIRIVSTRDASSHSILMSVACITSGEII